MAYNEPLAEDIRAALAGSDDGGSVDERKMFGGLAFMHEGRMFCGIVKDDLMLRLGPDQAAQALREPAVREMDFTGRPMRGFVFVPADAVAEEGVLESWIARALAFAKTLPRK